jgi:hypothetical protein
MLGRGRELGSRPPGARAQLYRGAGLKPPALTAGPQVPAKQLGGLVYPRPGHGGHQAGRRAKREFSEPSRHLPGVDRLE